MPSSVSQQLMFAQALSAVIEKLCNQALVYNLHGTRALAALNEKTLTVKLAELGFPINFAISAEKINVTSGESASDCCITASVKTLFALKEQQKLTDLIKQNQLDIDGDIKIAQRFADIASSFDIDWRTEFAKRIGDIPTYKLGQLGTVFANKLNFARQQIQADASEWLIHEKNILVTKSEVSYYYQDVEQVFNEVEQLSERIKHLIKQPNKAHSE